MLREMLNERVVDFGGRGAEGEGGVRGVWTEEEGRGEFLHI